MDPRGFRWSLIGRFLAENSPTGCDRAQNSARKLFERRWRRACFGGRETCTQARRRALAQARVRGYDPPSVHERVRGELLRPPLALALAYAAGPRVTRHALPPKKPAASIFPEISHLSPARRTLAGSFRLHVRRSDRETSTS